MLDEVEARIHRIEKVADLLKSAPAWLLPPSESLAAEYPNIYRTLEPLPQLHAGSAILVGYKEEGETGVLYALESAPHSSQPKIQIFQSAVSAWRDAVAAVPRCLPYFIMPSNWRQHRAIPSIREISLEDCLYTPNGHTQGVTELDGPSFGLGFAFAIASEYLGAPTDDDVVGLACCDAYGRLTKVDGLKEKLLAVTTGAPRIRRILLSKEQRRTEKDGQLIARYEANGDFEFVEVERLDEAFDHIFVKREESFADSISNKVLAGAENSEDFFEEMFDFLLCEPSRPNTYRPFIRTCDLLKQQFGEQQGERLAFMRAIASRREGDNEADSQNIPAETTHWFDTHAKWQRRVILSAYCRHSYDTGAPSLKKLTQWLQDEKWLKEGQDGLITPQASECGYYDLKLLNTYATLLEHAGKFVRAQRIAFDVANEWAKRRMYAQASRSLQRALILAGVLKDEETYAQSERLAQHVLTFVDSTYVGKLFIHLAQFRAAIEMEDDVFFQTFSYPSDEELERVHPHVRYGLERFVIQQSYTDPENLQWAQWAQRARKRLQESEVHNSKDKKLREEYQLIAALQDAVHKRKGSEVFRGSRNLSERKQLFGLVLNAVRKTKDLTMNDPGCSIEQVGWALNIYPY